jgi:hypothetical protein
MIQDFLQTQSFKKKKQSCVPSLRRNFTYDMISWNTLSLHNSKSKPIQRYSDTAMILET